MHKNKLYAGKVGQTHSDVLNNNFKPKKTGYTEFDHVISHPSYKEGFVNEKNTFMDRQDAYKHAHSNFLLHKDAAKEASNLTKHEYDDHELDAHELKSSSYWQQHPGSKYA